MSNKWKILALPLLIIPLMLMIGIEAKASYTAPDGNEYEYYYQTNQSSDNSYNYKIWSNYKLVAQNFYAYYEGAYMIGIYDDLTDSVGILKFQNNNSTYPQIQGYEGFGSNGIITARQLTNEVYIRTVNNDYANSTAAIYTGTNNANYFEYATSLSELKEMLTQGNIDYTTISYDPNYPYPWITAYAERGTMTGNCVPYKWVFDGITYDQNISDVYAFLAVRFWAPSKIKIDINNGNPTYEAITYESSESIPIWNFQDRHVIYSGAGDWEIDGMETTTAIYAEWDAFKQTVEPTFTSDVLDMSSSVFQDAVYNYNQYSGMQGTLGNKMQLKTCYFTTFNGYVTSGLFTVWNSTQPQTFDLQQIGRWANNAGKEASGAQYNEDVQSAVDSMEEESAPVPSDNPTNGINLNVNMNYQVPNTMQYPTVVAYNHDNLFTSMISTYNNASQFLGQFPAMFVDCLGWIPQPIWEVIALGFGVAILVMILKIL